MVVKDMNRSEPSDAIQEWSSASDSSTGILVDESHQLHRSRRRLGRNSMSSWSIDLGILRYQQTHSGLHTLHSTALEILLVFMHFLKYLLMACIEVLGENLQMTQGTWHSLS